MVHIINGRSGSGKSTVLLDTICERAKNNDNIILIVPEQASFQNESEILNRLGAKNARNIDVLSLQRLCDHIEMEYGKDSKKELSDGARLILMSLAIEAVQDKLELYGERTGKSDLTSLMLTAVSEYKICLITPEKLMELSKRVSDGRLRKKLHDSALIYEAYDALISETYIDPLDKLISASLVLAKNNFFSGKVVAIDSFHSFTAEELEIVSLAIQQSKDFYITLCRDIENNDNDSMFYFVNRTHSVIKKLASENGIKFEDINLSVDDNKRYKNDDLRYVEELIFRNEDLKQDFGGSVMLYEAEDIYDESEQVARDIKKLVADGYRYDEIAIICRDSEMYRGIINSSFKKYDIPLFVSYPERLEAKPLMRLVLSMLEAAVGNLTTESILTILKTGMTSIPDDDIFALENYAFVWNLKGSDWNKPFTRSIDGFIDRSGEDGAEILEKLEAHRKLISETIFKLRDNLKNADGAEMTSAVFKALEDFGAFEKVKQLSLYFEQNDESILAEEELRVWDMLMQLFDTLYETLKEKYISPKRYFELIEMIISQGNISTIPRTLDEVTLGNADTIRPDKPRIVFVIGAVDGIFPKTPTDNGIFTSLERDELISMALPLTDSIGNIYLQEEFFAYKACSYASEKLFISRYLENSAGETTIESKIISELREIFPDIKIRTRSDMHITDIVCSKAIALEQYALLKYREPSISATIGECIKKYPELSGRIDSTDRAFEEKPFQISDKKIAKSLFGNHMNISATQIEEYYRCPFRYFCHYGIKAKPSERAKFDPRQYGSAVHYIFEKLLSKEYGVEKLSEQGYEGRKKAVEAVLDSYLESLGGEEEKSASFMRMYKGIISSVMIILERLIAELTESEFKPVEVELPIGGDDAKISYKIILPDGGRVFIRGSVDRVDKMEKADENGKTCDYIRVIDYKTGNKKFVLDDILCGINVQMLLYLSAIAKNGNELFGDNIIPCGVLYVPSTSSYIDSENKSSDDIVDEREKELSMNGIVINDESILSAMNGSKGFVKFGKWGTNGRKTPIVETCSSKDFESIFDKIDEVISDMAMELRGGNISAEPLEIKKGTKVELDGCEYCIYDSICNFENSMKRKTHMRIDKAENVLKEIQEDEENNNGEE